MGSRISTPLPSRMKFLLLVSALLSVGLVQGLTCPSEGMTCMDPSGTEDADIDCNKGVLTWEDCGTLCSLVTECQVWTWRSDDLKCCLETKDTYCTDKDERVSGDKSCTSGGGGPGPTDGPEPTLPTFAPH